jgi:excisionase family DNA binding protein
MQMMHADFRFRCYHGDGPDVVLWLRQQGVQGKLRREAGDEIVEFAVPAEWTAEETDRFARALVERITNEALGHLTRLRRSPSSRHIDDSILRRHDSGDVAHSNRIPRRPTEAVPHSPYLDAEQAATYLGTTLSSLYGLVERRRLRPLRGPRRRYRFTTEMLDEYLRGGEERR